MFEGRLFVDGQYFYAEGVSRQTVKIISPHSLFSEATVQLEDWIAHRADLKFAEECVNFMVRTPELPSVAREAMWRCAIVHYCKCFDKSGPRKKNKLDPEEILPDSTPSGANPRIIHQDFVYFRNKHIIHDENGYRDSLLGACIDAPGQEYNVGSIVCAIIENAYLDSTNFTNLVKLIDDSLNWVETNYDAKSIALRRELEGYSRDELLGQDLIGHSLPKDVKSRRTRITRTEYT